MTARETDILREALTGHLAKNDIRGVTPLDSQDLWREQEVRLTKELIRRLCKSYPDNRRSK